MILLFMNLYWARRGSSWHGGEGRTAGMRTLIRPPPPPMPHLPFPLLPPPQSTSAARFPATSISLCPLSLLPLSTFTSLLPPSLLLPPFLSASTALLHLSLSVCTIPVTFTSSNDSFHLLPTSHFPMMLPPKCVSLEEHLLLLPMLVLGSSGKVFVVLEHLPLINIRRHAAGIFK